LWTHSKNKCVPVFLESAGFTHRFQIDLAFLQQGKECTAAPLFTQEPRRVNPQRVNYFIHSEDYKERRGQNEKGAGDAQHPHRRPRRGAIVVAVLGFLYFGYYLPRTTTPSAAPRTEQRVGPSTTIERTRPTKNIEETTSLTTASPTGSSPTATATGSP
jgi:hypothetical protein